MDALDLAVIHDAKNSLGNLLFRLENHGHLEKEMEIILKTSDRLTNLLLLHKQEAGLMQLNIDSASPSDLINDLADEFGLTFPHINIKVETEHAPAFWFYDEFYIRLALTNAVHNACEFANTDIIISAIKQDDYLLFQVQDNGNGYSDDMLETFAQHKQIETTHRGTGLGMMLAHNIAHMHQNKDNIGQVKLSNNATGALFEMRLP